ncbi:MAG: type II toxin-antitoxin system VapC family toxin [Deltaproteobacteria bacterium]|nr:type II toxin-antitoxin system VapC family toxin [Deltaproteobacteria bacterium]
MRLLVDSSSFAKRYIQEVGSDKLDEFLQQASELAICVILVPELISALNRRLREGALTERDYRKAKKLLLDDVGDATVLQLTPAVISRSVHLLENSVLRAMEALHVACALEWNADLFVTSDKKQLDSAVNSGLHTEYLGQQIATVRQ